MRAASVSGPGVAVGAGVGDRGGVAVGGGVPDGNGLDGPGVPTGGRVTTGVRLAAATAAAEPPGDESPRAAAPDGPAGVSVTLASSIPTATAATASRP